MYFGSLGSPLPLGVIIIIPGKPSEKVPVCVCVRVCARPQACVWGAFSPTPGLLAASPQLCWSDLGLLRAQPRTPPPPLPPPPSWVTSAGGGPAKLDTQREGNPDSPHSPQAPMYVRWTLGTLPSVYLHSHRQISKVLTEMCLLWVEDATPSLLKRGASLKSLHTGCLLALPRQPPFPPAPDRG